jgi:hypothetical protein
VTDDIQPADLFPAIDAFTNPIRKRIDPDDDTSTWQTTPSIWDQLLASTGRRGTAGSTAAMRSRPPVSTDVLSLVEEVRHVSGCQLRSMGQALRWRDCESRPMRDTPSELRAIHALLVPAHPTVAIAWVFYLRGWRREALRVLGLLTPRISLPRGVRCIDCDARDVTERNAYAEHVTAPAMRLLWDEDGRIHAVWCAACGSTRHPADLHLYAAQFAVPNYSE